MYTILVAIYSFSSLNKALEEAQSLPGTLEGFVLKQWDEELGRYRRVKIKGEIYLALHRVFSARSLTSLVKLVILDERAYFDNFPEYHEIFGNITG